ncbi:hypothetical protein FQN54_001944 [Arachnomyces sp. PD_36]|nr:hypothetical protein FQN54_001944 [Arachnomyces sp. PD_36]
MASLASNSSTILITTKDTLLRTTNDLLSSLLTTTTTTGAGEPPKWLLWSIPSLVLGYPILVSLLRFRRLRSVHKKYNYPTRESYAKMTDQDAFEIHRNFSWLEFPFVVEKALQFALFRTYGIPSISRLLVQTTEFTTPDNAPKRYVDTATLIGEFMVHPPSHPRTLDAISRVNYLHNGYRRGGKILDDDMLYTLSLFAIEPARWIETYEWRSLSDLEKCALGTFWKSIGDAMEISYEELPSGKVGFRDGLHWLEEMTVWSRGYEARNMVPAKTNRQTADETVNVLLWMVPGFMRPLGLSFVSYMMDERLREAMMYDPPSRLSSALFSTLFSLRKFYLRHLALPRPYFRRYRFLTETPDKNGRGYTIAWDAAPYYVKPTLMNRWGPGALLTWLMGRPVPGDEGEKYYPGGYVIEDVGPKRFEGKGREELGRTRERLEGERRGQCPFAFGG